MKLAHMHNANQRLADEPAVADIPAADLLVVELAALFHDIHDSKYEIVNNGDRLDLSSWLSARGVSDLQSSLIINIIDNVSYSKEVRLRATGGFTSWHQNCVELHCVMDADKLDALGAFGIFRCAAFSGSRNIPLYLREEAKGFNSSAAGHFHDKLFQLEDLMMTEVGRKAAGKRTAVMREFLKHLNDEADLRDFEEQICKTSSF
jgi:uncharacterized protein